MGRRDSKQSKRDVLDEALKDIPPDRPGLPARDSIEEVIPFVSPQHEHYRILRTSEMDAYDEKPSKPRKRKKS